VVGGRELGFCRAKGNGSLKPVEMRISFLMLTVSESATGHLELYLYSKTLSLPAQQKQDRKYNNNSTAANQKNLRLQITTLNTNFAFKGFAKEPFSGLKL
jgi:hypothetical protein